MRSRSGPVLVLAAALLVAWPAAGVSARPAQGIPEYGVLVSAIAGGLLKTAPVYTCPGPDVTPITEALEGPQAVRKIGLELVAGALGRSGKPWPRNHRAYTIGGRRWVPDFVKGRSFYLVDTGPRLDWSAELRDLQAIARRRGGELVVVTRRKTSISPALHGAVSRSWAGHSGRIRILRCV